MDLRIEKTKRSIYNAFIELRSKKPLEKLTVKELCETAHINKSTFYVYYRDIYDLSDKIEDEIVSSVLKNLDNTEDILNKTYEFSCSLFHAYSSDNALISTVFSGIRAQQLPRKIEKAIKDTIFEIYPQYRDDVDFNVKLTCSIYGGFYAYTECRNYGNERVIGIIGELSEKLMK